VISIDILPDDVLLVVFHEVFYSCMGEDRFSKKGRDWWQSLVHVCRRWRTVVFGSPRRLHLRLFCTARTPVRGMLDVWPPFPLVIDDTTVTILPEDADNFVAALERRDRVDEIHLRHANGPAVEKVLAAMQEPFPELTYLQLSSYNNKESTLPDSFLGGSAPRLRSLLLCGIAFPSLPKLLLSATHLVRLDLSNIPHSGYISPDAMVTTLSALTSLKSLDLYFQSPRSHPDQASRRPPPLTRTVLTALKFIYFKGVCEYLDDFVARIDAPRLYNLHMTFFNDVVFDAPQFIHFISRTPTLKPPKNAHVVFGHCKAIINASYFYEVGISCKELDWQVSSLQQLCASHFPPLSMLEDLYIYERLSGRQPDWQDNIEDTLWLELLHRFTDVKNLYLSKEFGPRIVAALQELVGGRMTEVLPTLQNIFLEEVEPGGRVQEDIGRIVSARQLSGHTITVSRWERDPRRERDLFPW
jgi:hypothetical protein